MSKGCEVDIRFQFMLSLQILIAKIVFALYRKFNFLAKNTRVWTIGVEETAAVLPRLSDCFDSKYTVCFSPHPFYSNTYSFILKQTKNNFFVKLFNYLFRAFLLGKLAALTLNFLYLGKSGFLVSSVDARAKEFDFLRQRNRKIVTMFLGADIRDHDLLGKLGRELQVDTYADIVLSIRGIDYIKSANIESRKLASTANKYADLRINAFSDQAAHLANPVIPYRYFLTESYFLRHTEKFLDLECPEIFHAPSNPEIKGTSQIREAMKVLSDKGYKFRYTEGINMSHVDLKEKLKISHIVINELFALMPGYLAVEAMAARCVVLTSANEKYEATLPSESNKAWVPINQHNLLDSVEYLLNHKENWISQADTGFAWAEKYAHTRKSEVNFQSLLLRFLNANT